ncbi:MAG TPA: glycoside hydrolase family 15 protein [Candidatus Saccharibacteria bacterium]|nr:glycoside hydrolase family 15 protein [Candidatus Saccharibacteria bacterium]HRQ06713.1 glycoside hydrolase family 15 protein [Candidatus Saccharibacteria bacterium]
MARPIVLSNGELHVGLNNFGMVHDFYFPYVGFENHVAGPDIRHHVGIWIDGQLSWLDNSGEWTFSFRYPHSALIGHTLAKNERMGIILEFDDFVDAHISVFLRNIHVINLRDDERKIRLFMHQAFAIGDSRSNTDTAQYLPDSDAILHYRGRRAFVISGSYNEEPFDQHTIGLFGIEGREGTFRDADDGELSESNVEHGRVDSTIRFCLTVPGKSSERVHYWIAAGTSIREALYVHKQVQDDGLLEHLRRTADWWHKWLEPACEIMDKIPSDYRTTFLQSVMIIKSQIDKHGAIMASTDTAMLNYSRDAYAYSWPRDGAYVIWPLIRMGYRDEAHRFFEFSRRGMHPSGYIMHKYRADGALGSSWHPYIQPSGIVSPPIQEDETALVVFMFAQFYNKHPEPALLKEFYTSFIVPMADFMTGFIEDVTGLPKPSYDLWEQTFLTSTYTTAVTQAALRAASDLASAADDQDNAVKWRTAADDIQIAAQKHLYNQKRKSFYRGLNVYDGKIELDSVIDSSAVMGAYMFGLFAPDSEEMTSAIETHLELFGINQGAPGLPRYEDDDYRRANSEVTGNYWFISSLWLAQYYVDTDQNDKAKKILDWTKTNSLSTGIMAEQLDPITQVIVSPAPLTWTHAEYVATILDMVSEV